MISEDANERELGFLLLFSLHESISSYISLNDLLHVLNNGLNDPEFSVCLRAGCDLGAVNGSEGDVRHHHSEHRH